MSEHVRVWSNRSGKLKAKTKISTGVETIERVGEPPSYDEALMLPAEDEDVRSTSVHIPTDTMVPEEAPSSRQELDESTQFSLSWGRRRSSGASRRRHSIEEVANEESSDDADDNGTQTGTHTTQIYKDDVEPRTHGDPSDSGKQKGATTDVDDDDTYSLDDADFEPIQSDLHASHNLSCRTANDSTNERCSTNKTSGDTMSTRDRNPSLSAGPPTLLYDEGTYRVVGQLRTLTRQLRTRLDKQIKLTTVLQEEKLQHEAQIRSLQHELLLHKQMLHATQVHPHPRPNSNSPGRPLSPKKPSVPATHSLLAHENQQSPPSYEVALALPGVQHPNQLSPRRQSATFRTSSTSSRPTSPLIRAQSPGSPAHVGTHRSIANNHKPPTPGSFSAHSGTTTDTIQAAKFEKLEMEKRDMAKRHAHQLANYSHELSRLEREVEAARKLVQAKDNALRLQKSRLLYTCCGNGGGNGPTLSSSTATSSSTARHRDAVLAPSPVVSLSLNHHHQTLLADSLWRALLPSAPPAGNTLAQILPFTSHVGQAFEELLAHPLLALHDLTVDGATRDWLKEIRACGFRMLAMHHAFQCMSVTLRRLAECSHVYQFADAITEEAQRLTHAEQAMLFVLDPEENELWCRVPHNRSSSSDTDNSSSERNSQSRDMVTVRSRLMPLVGNASGVSAVAAEHSGTSAAELAALGTTVAPSGLASWVFHTQRPLLLPAGAAARHSHFSTAPDNTDRLMTVKSASTLLLPVMSGTTTLGVLQVWGKLTHVAALGVEISLEQGDAFTLEDQVVLTLLVHHASVLLPKVKYFTEVESNKVNEETLLQLAPEIFTCLRFDELGKVAIQNAKQVLDADRCSLFVADAKARELVNWQSDIAGRGGVEVVADAQRAVMKIPFGHGLVGMVAETKRAINIPDAYEDPRFNSSWDKKTKYRTKSILTVPILTTAMTEVAAIATAVPPTSTSPLEKEPPLDLDQGVAKEPVLLGVVQVINKSGGAPFRAKDEFLLHTIAKLIALAIENSQLFQKNQELCVSLGQLIADADLAAAVTSLGGSAEAIIGVERAAVYVFDTASRELVTFHRKRHHQIVLAEPMYKHSLMEQAILSQEMLIVNDICTANGASATSSSTSGGSGPGGLYNAYVDSIGGIPARNVLFAPLLIDDPEEPHTLTGAVAFAANEINHCGSTNTRSGKKLVGLLHLVNTRGRKQNFDPHDLFLSIVASQTCSVISSLLEKQRLLRQQEQTRHVLDATLSFFKEMSPVGVINAVFNTCASIFHVQRAHLFLREQADDRVLWTSRLAPPSTVDNTNGSGNTNTNSGGTAGDPGGSAGRQPPRMPARRISVLTDQRIRVPATEGLMEHVLGKGSLAIVQRWVTTGESASGAPPNDGNDNGNGNDDADDDQDHDLLHSKVVDASDHVDYRQRPRGLAARSMEVSRGVFRATRADVRAGFTDHAVVACPVWDLGNVVLIGVLVLLFPTNHAPPMTELSNLPLLTRQIAGALHVCSDLGAEMRRCQWLQDLAEWAPRSHSRTRPRPRPRSQSQSQSLVRPSVSPRQHAALSMTLNARGQLVSFSLPINLGTTGFSRQDLLAFLHAEDADVTAPHASGVVDVSRVPMDAVGHRWVFQLTGATLSEMTSQHCTLWVGRGLESPGCRGRGGGGGATVGSPGKRISVASSATSSASSSFAFDRFCTDLQGVFLRKERAHGTIMLYTSGDGRNSNINSDEEDEEDGDDDGNDDDDDGANEPTRGSVPTLSSRIKRQLRRLLWRVTDAQWRVDEARIYQLFDAAVDRGVGARNSRRVTRRQLEDALMSHAPVEPVSLSSTDWDLVHARFADPPSSTLMDVTSFVRALTPRFRVVPCIAYELVPVLDTLTQSVVHVHVLLSATTRDAVSTNAL